MTSELMQRAVTATLWSGVDALTRQGLQFLVSLILARLLTPHDYGTVGLLAIFLGLAGALIQAGFPSALIQRMEITSSDLSSVFYVNLIVSLVLAFFLSLVAPWIAAFYNVPVLQPLVYVFAVTLVIGSFGVVQSVLLTRALDFRRQCLISLIAQITSGAIAVYLAWKGYGVWSLAAQTLLGTAISTVLLWTSSSWRPHLAFSISSIRSLFRFGGFLLLSSLLDSLFTRLNTLVIGKLYAPSDVGYYSRADQTQLLPASLISSVISRVAFPLFSRAQQDRALLKSGLQRALSLAMLVNIPVMLGIASTAKPLVLVLFGNQWLPSVPYLQVLSLSGVFWPLHILNLNILTAKGHSNLYFRIEVLKKAIGIVLIVAASAYSVLAIAWALVFSSVISFFLNAHYSGRSIGYGSFAQLVDLLPYVGAAVPMLLFVWLSTYLPITSPALQLSLQVFGGALVYVLVCALFSLSGFLYAWGLICPLLRRCLPQAWLPISRP